MVVAIDVEVLLEHLIGALSLAITLWVVTGGELEAHIKGFSKRAEEVGDELSSSVGGDVGRYTLLGEYME